MNRALKSNTEGITLSMDCERIGGEVVRKRVEDGNGNLLLFARIGCGYSGCGQIIADMVGKRVGEGRSVEEVELSGEERADVGLGAL